MNAEDHPIPEAKIKQGLVLCQAMFQKKGVDLDALANIMARSINPEDFDSPRHFLECCREHMRRGRYLPVLVDLLAVAGEARTASYEAAWVKLHSWASSGAQAQSWDDLKAEIPEEAIGAFHHPQVGGATGLRNMKPYDVTQAKAVFLAACRDPAQRFRVETQAYKPPQEPDDRPTPEQLAETRNRLRQLRKPSGGMDTIGSIMPTPPTARPKPKRGILEPGETAEIEALLAQDRRR